MAAAVLVFKDVRGDVPAQFVSVLREVRKVVEVVGDAVGHRVQEDDVGGQPILQLNSHRFCVQQDNGRAFGFSEQKGDAVEGGGTRRVFNQRGHAQRFRKLGALGIEKFRQINGREMWGDGIHGTLHFWRASRRLMQLSR